MLPFKRKFRDSQIDIITTFVVVSSVGIKRVACIDNSMNAKNIIMDDLNSRISNMHVHTSSFDAPAIMYSWIQSQFAQLTVFSRSIGTLYLLTILILKFEIVNSTIC